MIKRMNAVTVVLGFLGLHILIWLAFAVLAVLGLIPGLPDSGAALWIMAGLAFACSCALAVLVVLLNRRVRLGYYLAVAALFLLAALTFTDDVGWIDWAYFAIVAVPLVLLFTERAWFLGKAPKPEQ
ncbi:MAG: hypothetical protein JW929_05675 [Anaerolineales bacterium]|nr:hypothetical protein [Anaerolineales bacterium]